MKLAKTKDELKTAALKSDDLWFYDMVDDDAGGLCPGIKLLGIDPSLAKVTFEYDEPIVCLNKSSYWFELSRLYDHTDGWSWHKQLEHKTWVSADHLKFIDCLCDLFPEVEQ